MRDVLISGENTFNIDVPYTLIEAGEKNKPKPLIVYLHGFNQNIKYFEKKTAQLLTIQGYHLFIQAPYPVYDTSRKLEISKWGRAWYLYDGSQEQFLKSMEKASEFIEDVLAEVSMKIDVSRLCIFGYSMGGYLGGYFALSRPKLVNDLVVIGGRIKTEAFEGTRESATHINILALHGKDDESVYPKPQKIGIELLKKEGFNAEFKLVKAGHPLNEMFIKETESWLKKNGYIASS